MLRKPALAVAVAGTAGILWRYLVAVPLLRRLPKPNRIPLEGDTSIEDAVAACRRSESRSWDLVAYAQRLVARKFTYSRLNTWDTPSRAFARGLGYCEQQTLVLKRIYDQFGINARPVFAVRCRFPPKTVDGMPRHGRVTGHTWLRVRIGADERDVCPGSPDNNPGVTHFQVLSPVHIWYPRLRLWTHLGSSIENIRRDRVARSSLKSVSATEAIPAWPVRVARRRGRAADVPSHADVSQPLHALWMAPASMLLLTILVGCGTATSTSTGQSTTPHATTPVTMTVTIPAPATVTPHPTAQTTPPLPPPPPPPTISPPAPPTTGACTPPAGVTPVSSSLVVYGTPRGHQVTLTFDAGGEDGARATQILSTLASRQVHATWFLTGKWAQAHPDLVLRIRDAGHDIGNHTVDHPDLTRDTQGRLRSDTFICNELAQAGQIISGMTGRTTRPFFRPPNGAYNDQVRTLAARLGYRTVYWSIDPIDWSPATTKQDILNRVLESPRLKPGAIILLHAGGPNTPAALNALISGLLARGYVIVPLSVLLQ